jgi:hypothetical protein
VAATFFQRAAKDDIAETTMDFELFIFIAGLLHFGILLASALVPKVLDWRESLQHLDPLFRQLVWVHGAFIVLVIVGFGLLSVVFAAELASGTRLARGVCSFIAFFWGARLAVQFFVFDPKPHLTSMFLKLGYHGLTIVFLYLVVVYSLAALAVA